MGGGQLARPQGTGSHTPLVEDFISKWRKEEGGWEEN